MRFIVILQVRAAGQPRLLHPKPRNRQHNMLTLKFITENRDEVVRRLGKKHFKPAAEMIDRVITLDTDRRSTQKELDAKQAQMNQLSKSIGALMQAGKKDEANEAKAKTAEYKEEIKALQSRMDESENSIRDLLLQIPNLPNETVPDGYGAEDNKVERMGGTNPVFEGFKPLPDKDNLQAS